MVKSDQKNHLPLWLPNPRFTQLTGKKWPEYESQRTKQHNTRPRTRGHGKDFGLRKEREGGRSNFGNFRMILALLREKSIS